MRAPELLGERVALRPMEGRDAELVAGIRATPEVARWWNVRDAEYMRAKLDRDDVACWVIELDGKPIGFAQAYEELRADYRHAGLDLFLHPDHHGQGLGRDTVRAVVEYLIGDRDHHRLVIDPAAENQAAICCFEAVGFKPIGIARRYWWDHVRGDWVDGLLMDLLADDPKRP